MNATAFICVVALVISAAALQPDGNRTESFTLIEVLNKVNNLATEPTKRTDVLKFWN